MLHVACPSLLFFCILFFQTSHHDVQCQLPRELFILNWHERKVSCPEALHQGQSLEDSGLTLNLTTPSPTILFEMKEILAQDDDQVRVFGPGHASQELALQNEAFYSVSRYGSPSSSRSLVTIDLR